MPAVAFNDVLFDYCDFHTNCPGVTNNEACFASICISRSQMCAARFRWGRGG
jgi:hypothetical protein